MDEQMADRLCTVPMFADLDRDHLRAVAKLVIEFEAPSGHVLVQPGLVGAGLFLIEEGTAKLSVHNEEIEVGPGEMIGELALLDDRAVHTARVRTTSPVKGYCIQRDDFITLLHDEPRIALPILRVIAKRLADLILHH
jgi:CRP/FNR family transcriptional regulator, cyclic AMP receptor protein